MKKFKKKKEEGRPQKAPKKNLETLQIDYS